MLEIGCVGNFNYPYKDEVDFAKANDLKILQLWYDKYGISLTRDRNPLESIKNNDFPAIIHAVLDINEFEEHTPKLCNILKEINHNELIIHPVCKSEEIIEKTIGKLSKKIKYAYNLLSKMGIKLYIENNSKLDPILNTPREVEYLFNENPDVSFILDVAHIESYSSLKDIVNAKFPEMLHISDKHFDVIHEHLPLGEGELDLDLIFSEYLKGFNGKIILEITQSKDAIIRSRDLLKKAFK